MWTLPPISCGSLGWYKPMWTMCNLESFQYRPTTVTLVAFRGLCVDIGAIALIAPSICARLVTKYYLFFTQPSYHPSRAVGRLATDSTIRIVARLGEKIVFIGNQTCTNCWRYRTDIPLHHHNTTSGQNMPTTLKMADLEYNSHCMPLE